MSDATVSILVDGMLRTPKVSGLTWTRDAPGGCRSAEFQIEDALLAERIAPDQRVIISLGETGKTLWDGDIRDPGQRGRAGKRDGQVAVSGSVARLDERKWKLPYVVSGPGSWVDEDIDKITFTDYDVRGDVAQETAQAGDGSTRAMLTLRARGAFQFGWRARARVTAFDGADLTIGAFRFTESDGFSPANAANWRFRVIVGDVGLGMAEPVSHNPDYYPMTSIFAGVTPSFNVGSGLLRVDLQYEALPTLDIGDDSWRVSLSDLAVVGARKQLNGANAPLTSSSTVTTEAVVADIVGRSGCIDSERAWVSLGATIIDDLNFADPVGLSEVLNRLLAFEQAYVWQMMPSSTTAHSFYWGPWPTDVRYSLSMASGAYTETIREDVAYNRVSVWFRDRLGRLVEPSRIDANPDTYPYTRLLTEQGRIRDFPVEIDTGGSRANANAIAAAIAPDLFSLKVAATYGTAQPVLDLYTGCYVHPFEVEPGYLARVEDTNEVHRITQTVCDGDAGTANLTLGSPARTAEDVLAYLTRRRRN